jgi:hypothetical protein
MPQDRTRLLVAALLIAILALLILVFGLAGSTPPTDSIVVRSQLQTAAVLEFIAQMTGSAPPPSPTRPVAPSSTAVVPTSASGTPDCLGLRFVRDVTVPDNTEMDPAEVFTKSWQVENSGTCAWKPGFQVVLVGGVAMGGSPFKVTQTVGPGGSIQVSIKMAAPTSQSGVVQGTWKMTDEQGSSFGDYLSVVIVARGRTQASSTPTVLATP